MLLEHQVLDPLVRKHLAQLHRSAITMTALITDLSHGFSLDDTDSLELERLDLVRAGRLGGGAHRTCSPRPRT